MLPTPLRSVGDQQNIELLLKLIRIWLTIPWTQLESVMTYPDESPCAGCVPYKTEQSITARHGSGMCLSRLHKNYLEQDGNSRRSVCYSTKIHCPLERPFTYAPAILRVFNQVYDPGSPSERLLVPPYRSIAIMGTYPALRGRRAMMHHPGW